MNHGSFYHSARHNADNVYHWIDDCGHGSRIRERCYIVECSPPKERYCHMCQSQSPLEEPTSNVLQPEPAARGSNRVKHWFVSAAIWVGIIVGFILALLGIQSHPLGYGEVLTIVGIWLMFGVLLGQNKPQKMAMKVYLNRRIRAVAASWLLFNVMALIYMIMAEGQNKPELTGPGIIGLLVLSGIGLVLGFMAGVDREDGP